MFNLRSKIEEIARSLEHNFHTLNNIEISRQAILNNFDYFEATSGKLVIPVLKSNAYGCGIEQVSTVLKERSFPYIAVDGYFEALRVMKVSKQPVLIMGYIHPNNINLLRFRDNAFVIHDKNTINELGKVKKNIKVHLEINSGMNRHGIQPGELIEYLQLIKQYKNLKLEGIMSHLADADNYDDNSYTIQQEKVFYKCLDRAYKTGFKPDLIHLGQTAGSKALSKDNPTNAIRLGIGLYGISPVVDSRSEEYKDLKQVLTLKSTITKVINLTKGDKVSYNGTFTAQKAMRIGILPLGYYEGINRELSNQGSVLYKENPLPIVGRICMNHMMINLEDTDANYGSEVIVISDDSSDVNCINNIAKQHNLFVYSLMTSLNENLRRVIVS